MVSSKPGAAQSGRILGRVGAPKLFHAFIDYEGAPLPKVRQMYPHLAHVFVDGGYIGGTQSRREGLFPPMFNVLRPSGSWPSLVILIWWLSACSSPSGPAQEVGPSLRILSTPIPNDTANAGASATIQVEVQDQSGQLRSGIVVQFESSPPTILGPNRKAYVTLETINGRPLLAHADTTNRQGQIGVAVRRGYVSGTGFVQVRVPELLLHDSIPFTILAATPQSIRVQPTDTSVLVGGGYQLTTRVQDQFSNLIPASVQYSTPSPSVTIGADGVVHGVAFARATISVKSGDLTTASQVSVVPVATIAMTILPNQVAFFRTDGAGFSRYDILPFTYYADRGTSWSADGSRVVFFSHSGIVSENRLFTVDGAGHLERVIQTQSVVLEEFWPHYSRDSQWIYYTGTPDESALEIWRVHPDGMGQELVSPSGAPDVLYSEPSPAPEGTRLALVTNPPTVGAPGLELAVLNVVTKQVTDLGITAALPQWSPVGEQIAYINDGRIHLVNADGSGDLTLSASGNQYLGRVDWSPDGRWLVAVATEPSIALHLIEVQTGLTLPLAFARGTEASWRPR